MEIVYKSLDEIMPYEFNPRNNDEAVDYVANSIKEYGFNQPIVIDAAGVIVAGHTRFRAAQKLGLEKVPCLMKEDLTPYQIRAYRLADNKTAEFSNWDYSLLEQELAELEDVDMSKFGFIAEENLNIDDLMDDLFEDTTENNADTFTVSFTFPKEYEEQINALIARIGKDAIAEQIIQEALGE